MSEYHYENVSFNVALECHYVLDYWIPQLRDLHLVVRMFQYGYDMLGNIDEAHLILGLLCSQF